MATPFSTTSKAFSEAPYNDSPARREELKTSSTMCDDRKKEVTGYEETLSKLDTDGEQYALPLCFIVGSNPI
jgi:hypothetical protein